MLYFYILPLTIFIIASVLLFFMNQSFLKNNLEKGYFEKLNFLGSFFKMELSKQKSFKELELLKDGIVKELYGSKDVIYYAFRINKEDLWSWESKYEGFLPIFGFSPKKELSVRVLKTPVGRVYELNVKGVVEGKEVIFTVGFMQEYSAMLKRMHIRILVIFNILIAVFLFLYYIKIMEYNTSVVEREKIIEKERREKKIFKTLSVLSMALSHELRNPLNTLYLIFEKLGVEKESEKVQELIKRGGEEIERIKRFTRSFEMLIKKEAGDGNNNISQAKESVDLNILIFSLLNNLEREYQVNLSLKENGENLVVEGDQELLSILFYYLIKGFCEGAGKNGFVSIVIDSDKREITIKGSGKTKFFEVIHMDTDEKLEKIGTKGVEDTAFLVKKIVEFHRWKIEHFSYELGDMIILKV